MPKTRPQRARCSCMNGADAPSTHRGANHLDPHCPHSTLMDTTQRYEEVAKARAVKAQRRMRGKAVAIQPVRVTVLGED